MLKSTWTLYIGVLLLQWLGLLTFIVGYFPQSSTPSGSAHHNVATSPSTLAPTRRVGKTVIMLVDALRADVVLQHDSDGFVYVRNALASNDAIAFVAHAQSPTVTMPRIKAFVSGSIPSFLDLLYNFDSQALHIDNIITQWRQRGDRVVFYGDDTWLKLFPNTFHRAEGTTSFFVTDTVRVDNNVTRHVLSELPEREEDADWDVLILHYLGLDHVGHWQGAHSTLMTPKRREMDRVFRFVHSRLRQWRLRRERDGVVEAGDDTERSLLMMCSDHGMNEYGNHGGSTLGETSSILVLADDSGEPVGAPKMVNSVEDFAADANSERWAPLPLSTSGLTDTTRRVSQVDVVPTLALLHNVPIPLGSVGVLIREPLLRMMRPGIDELEVSARLLDAYYTNAQQHVNLLRLQPILYNAETDAPQSMRAQTLFDAFDAVRLSHEQWAHRMRLHANEASAELRESASIIADEYDRVLRMAQDQFEALLTSSDVPLLLVSCACLSAAALVSLVLYTKVAGRAPSSSVAPTRLQAPSLLTLSAIVVSILLAVWLLHGVVCAAEPLGSALLCAAPLRPLVVGTVFLATLCACSMFVLLNYSVRNLFGVTYRIVSGLVANRFAVPLPLLLVAGYALHLMSLWGTSLVEEEHQTHYFLVMCACVWLLLDSVYYVNGGGGGGGGGERRHRGVARLLLCLCVAFVTRLTRSWNQTGVKWSDDGEERDDVGVWLNEHTGVRAAAWICALFCVGVIGMRRLTSVFQRVVLLM